MRKPKPAHIGKRNRRFQNSGLVTGLTLCWWLINCLSAGASDWLTVAGKAVFSGTDTSKARVEALADAHQEAIFQAFGKDISVEDLFVNLRLSGSIMGAIPCGRVLDSQITKDWVKPVAGTKRSSVISEYWVELKAQVDRCPYEAPSDFSLDARLNKTEFKDGDPVMLTLTASRDCHYYIFNILEDEKVLRLMPNRVRSDNRLTARQTIRFPNDNDSAQGVHTIAHLPPKRSQTTEAIYVLALCQPVDFSGLGIQEGLFGLYDGRTAFMEAVIRLVATIPVSQRAEQLVRYQIKAKT